MSPRVGSPAWDSQEGKKKKARSCGSIFWRDRYVALHLHGHSEATGSGKAIPYPLGPV